MREDFSAAAMSSSCIQILLHVRELLNDGTHAVSEPRTGQVLINHLCFGLLPFASKASCGNLNDALPNCDGDGNGTARLSNPDAIDIVERFQSFGKHSGNKKSGIRFGCALIIPQLGEPPIDPVLRPLTLPENRAARLSHWANDLLQHIPTKLSLRNRFDTIMRKLGS